MRKMFSTTQVARSALLAGVGFAAVALSSTAYAQDAGTEEGADEAPAVITVTGSRIPRPDLESASPVTTVSAETISLTGTLTLEELINDLPSVIPGNNRTSNNSGGESFATLDLRGLGPNRTLILVDGERLAASSTTGAIDISQIPTALIQRVDVVTGGATAVYGSDAVAGVINFVLRDDYEGIELTAQTGVAEAGVGNNYSITGLFGGNFDDGRGNLVLSAQYFDREAVSQNRFDYSRVSGALGIVGGVLQVVDSPSDLNLTAGDFVIFPGGSGTNPFGTVVQNGSNPFRNLSTAVGGNFAGFDNDCNPATANTVVNSGSLSFDANGALRPNSTGGLCQIPVGNSSRFNFAPLNFLSIPFDRLNVSAIGNYEFSNTTSLKLFSSYSRTTSVQNLAPTPAAGGTGFVIDPTTAFGIPADLAAALNSRTFFRRDTALGTNTTLGGMFGSAAACTTPTTGQPAQFVCSEQSGATLPFSFNRRFAETGPRVGTNESQQIQLRALLTHELTDSLTLTAVTSYGRTDFDSYNQGNINRVAVEQGINGCRNSAGVVNGPGVLPGCVPVNIFGANSITPAQRAFIQTDTFDFSEFEQVRGAVNIAGSLFELPGGPLGIAVGAEVRTDRGLSVPDDAKIRGEIIGFNASQPIAGEITVREFYGEVRVPLFELDGREFAAVTGGARYSDYSSVGGLFNWKVEGEITPISAVKLRGTYNRAARAPSVFELFQNGDQGFPSYTDPCNQTNTQRDTAFCQSQFTANGASSALVTGFAQTNQQVQAFAFGNPNLTEEKGETWTVGVVLQPDQFPLGRPSLTVDYYNIKLSNRIAAQGAQFFLNQCYGQQLQTACDRIVRSAVDGQVTSVNTTLVNGDTDLVTSGIDASLKWAIPLGDGQLTIEELLTWVDEFSVGGNDFVDLADAGLGAITSEWASTFSLGYQTERFNALVRWIYKSGGDQSGALFGPDDATGFTTPRVPDLNVVNLSLRYRVTDNFDITGIVNNVLDETPPQTAVGTFEQSNTNVSFYSPLIFGRNYSLQARVRF